MDTHNLATVITPNILKEKTPIVGMDESSFLAIEAVNSLIEYNDQMCEVPEDLQSILNDSSLFNNSSDITTKEILKRYADIGRSPAHRPHITDPAAAPNQYSNNNTAIPSSSRSDGTAPNGAARPVITHIDTDPYTPQSSVRPVAPTYANGHSQQRGEYAATSGAYASANRGEYAGGGSFGEASAYHRRQGSSESQISQGERDRRGYRHSGWGGGGGGGSRNGPPPTTQGVGAA